MRVWRSNLIKLKLPVYFNSHTREGVTIALRLLLLLSYISTHTPVRVWLAVHDLFNKLWRFQLTHPWGCDLTFVKGVVEQFISTHTPVRVWRRRDGWTTSLSPDFNSHTREGVTYDVPMERESSEFQLTHPWGCDRCPAWICRSLQYFNSHTREGVTRLQQIG